MLRKIITKISLALCLCMAWINIASADGEQLYFTGMVAPLGSLSQESSGVNAVYLRWDITEGNLAADVNEFELRRNGTPIATTFYANQVMDNTQIEALYAKPGQSRRQAEIIRILNDVDATLINSSNFAISIFNKISSSDEADVFWSTFASRLDMNIAQARYRGYVDTEASGLTTYELHAYNTGHTITKLVGRIQVDASSVNVLPAVGGFTQVSRFDNDTPTGLGRCDALNERFKDHGTVALTWEPAAATANRTDRYVSILSTTGFDVYRSVDHHPARNMTPPVIDIRALSQAQSHDGVGGFSLPGLVKVNDVPVSAGANVVNDPLDPFFKPAFYQYLTTHREFIAEGVNPGEHYFYYMVARDFTGNYGDTAVLEVTVPDLIAPPSPWRIDVVVDPVNDTFKLTWDHVDLLNYQRSHDTDRTYCNLNTARFDKALKYVDEGKECLPGTQKTVDLNVSSYRVYRFRNSAEANAFTDSDADGFSDADERAYDHDGDSGTAKILDSGVIGSACDSGDFPTLATSYAIGQANASGATPLPSGRKVISFTDSLPASEKGNVFWYRIASRDPQGNIGVLSPPKRAVFPASSRPERGPLLTAKLGARACTYQVQTVATGADVPFADNASGANAGDASSVLFDCGSTGTYTSLLGDELSHDMCSQLDAECVGKNIDVTYLGANGASLASLDGTGAWTSCPNEPKTQLTKTCTGPVVGAAPGDVVEGPVSIDVDIPVGTCAIVERRIGDQYEPIETFCYGATMPALLDVPSLSDLTCLSVSLQNNDNEISSRFRLPCITIIDDNTAVPARPGILSVNITSNKEEMQIQLLPPEQPLAGTIVEWYWKDDLETTEAVRRSEYFPHAQASAFDGDLRFDLSLTTEQSGSDWSEDWCVRARSVAKTNPELAHQGLSSWSPWSCETRRPAAAVVTDYLPWPNIKSAEYLGYVAATYLPFDQQPVLKLSSKPIVYIQYRCNVTDVLSCDTTDDVNPEPCLSPVDASGTINASCEEFCPRIVKSMPGALGFVVYRQRASDKNIVTTYGDYLQVSPLIKELFCKTSYKSGTSNPDVIMRDPYITLADFTAAGTFNGLNALYRDHYPVIMGQHYRYQIVYFDSLGEIVGYRKSDWITIN